MEVNMADIISELKGGMFDSTEVTETPGGFPRGNKAVDSAFFAKMISSFYSDGVLYGDGFSVTPAGGMTVSVKSGIAWAKGYMALLENDSTVTLAAGKTYAALIRLNTALGEFSLIFTENTAALPTRTSSVTDLIIAEITVPSGASSVTAAMITDTRANGAKCGYVKSAIDALGVAAHADDCDTLDGHGADEFVRKDGAQMTGTLVAAAMQDGRAAVRNISYGTSLPQTLGDGEIFILVSE